MSLSHRYRQLATLIEALEADGITVEEAEPVGRADGQSPEEGFRVRLSLELPADARVGRLGTDSAESTRRTSLQPVGTSVSASDALGDDKNSHSTDAVDDTSEARDSTSTAVGESAEAVSGGGHTATASRDDDAPADGAVVEAERPASVDSTESTDSTDSTTAQAAVDRADATATDEKGVTCTHPDCGRSFDTERGMKIHRTKAHPLSEIVDDEQDRTVHHDPSVLARVYEEHGTFAEMTEALDVDVGAQAVRKQMIRHGIHKPGTGDSTGGREQSERGADDEDPKDSADSDQATAHPDESDDSDETVESEDSDDSDETGLSHESNEDSFEGEGTGSAERVDERADGGKTDSTGDTTADAPSDEPMVSEQLPDLDLPGSLSTADLQTAVEEATTLYDVQRSLGLDRETTRDVLAAYDLLELVSGRAASLRDREELKTEINQRIRRRAT